MWGISNDLCPICHILEREVFDRLRASLNRWKTEEPERQPLIEAGGFCETHAAAILHTASPPGVAAFVQTLADSAARAIEAESAEERHAVWWKPKCPLCQFRQEREAALLSRFRDTLADPAVREEYARGLGLCLPHLDQIQEGCEDPVLLGFLRETTAAQLRRWAEACRSYIEKHEANSRDEMTLVERRAWIALTEKLAGHREDIRLS